MVNTPSRLVLDERPCSWSYKFKTRANVIVQFTMMPRTFKRNLTQKILIVLLQSSLTLYQGIMYKDAPCDQGNSLSILDHNHEQFLQWALAKICNSHKVYIPSAGTSPNDNRPAQLFSQSTVVKQKHRNAKLRQTPLKQSRRIAGLICFKQLLRVVFKNPVLGQKSSSS